MTIETKTGNDDPADFARDMARRVPASQAKERVMNMFSTAFAVAVIGLAVAVSPTASAQDHPGQTLVLPEDIKWADVPSLPPGAKISVIEGPLNEPKPFTIRLKLPANYVIPPHSHPAIERVTVLSGTFNLGMGDKMDKSKTKPLQAGALAIMQPKNPHFAWTDAETIVQLHGVGPWGVVYANPTDDPRKQ